MIPRPHLAVVAVLALCCAGPARGAWFGSVETGIDYDDNVSRAVLDKDQEDDVALLVAPSGGYRWQLGKNGSLALRGLLEAVLADNDRLQHFDPGFGVTYRQKTRLGTDAPYFELGLSARQQAYDSDVREGSLLDGRFTFGMPVGERWEYRLQLEYSTRDADVEAFSQDAVSFTFANELFLTPRGVLRLHYRYRTGDITSSATNPEDEPRTDRLLTRTTAPPVDDDAFEDDRGKPLIAYRLDATTHALRVAWNQSLGAHHAVEVGIEHQLTEADDVGDDYSNTMLRASYLYRF